MITALDLSLEVSVAALKHATKGMVSKAGLPQQDGSQCVLLVLQLLKLSVRSSGFLVPACLRFHEVTAAMCF